MAIRARFLDSVDTIQRNAVRLVLVDDRPDGRQGLLLSDGMWQTVDVVEAASSLDVGIVIPRSAVDAIVVAAAEYRGGAVHGQTEAAVLREWLSYERQRVDRVLRALSPEIGRVYAEEDGQ